MPTNLPVPSRNALRALRHLALGTTCTLAIGAGVLTEDRRRRIHAATAVRGNKEKIKASKSYKNGNSDEAFAALISKLQVEDLHQPRESPHNAEPSKPQSVVKPEIPIAERSTKRSAKREPIDTESLKRRLLQHGQSSPSGSTAPTSNSFKAAAKPDFKKSVLELHPLGKTSQSYVPIPKQNNMDKHSQKTNTAAGIPKPATSHSTAPAAKRQTISRKVKEMSRSLAFDEAESSKRQQRLADDVQRLLSQQPTKFADATARFVEAFADGLPIGREGLEPVLMTAAIKLSNRLWEHSKEKVNPILDIVLRHPICKTEFDTFQPADWISRILSRSGYDVKGQKTPLLEVDVIEKAAAIYLTKFKDNLPYEMSHSMKNVGTKLCRESCRSGLYHLTILVFRHREAHRGISPNTSVDALIEATANLGNHMDMFRYYQELYSQTVPTELEFWRTQKLVIKSLLTIGELEKAEEVVVTAGALAQNHGLKLGTTSLLKVLGANWRTYRNIEQVQALFNRLKPFISASNHPEACYGVIIQCYVEAGDEATAWSYYEEMQNKYPSRHLRVSILGHLALAKALRHDWAGVEDDFRKIKKMAPATESESITISFVPILKVFASSHCIADTEDFVRHFFDDLELVMTPHLVNFMVQLYAKMRDIDSISRWVQFCIGLDCEVDSVFFNTLLNQCYDSWMFSFQEVENLYRQVWRMDQGRYFFDRDTTSMLRRIKTAANYKDTRKSTKLISLAKPDSLVNPENVHLRMSESLHNGEFSRVLDIYVDTANEGKPLYSQQLMLAIHASLAMNSEDFDSCRTLIRHADDCGMNTIPHISYLSYRQTKQLLEAGEINARNLANTYMKYTSLLVERGKQLPIEMITHAMKLMMVYDRNTPLDFWKLVCEQGGLNISSLDVPALTVFLELYICQNNADGVKWTIEMLLNNRLIPDRRFLRYLYEERQRLDRLSIDSSYPEAKQQYVQQIHNAVKRVVEMRRDVCENKKFVLHVILDIIRASLSRRDEKQQNDLRAIRANLQSAWSNEQAEQRQVWPKIRNAENISGAEEDQISVEALTANKEDNWSTGHTIEAASISLSHPVITPSPHTRHSKGSKSLSNFEGHFVKPPGEGLSQSAGWG